MMIETDAAGYPSAVERARAPHSPVRLILAACMWLALSGVVPLLGLLLAMVGNRRMFHGAADAPLTTPEASALLVVAGVALGWLFAVSWFKAPRVGLGNRAAGLGVAAVQRPRWIAALIVFMACFTVGEVWLVQEWSLLRFMRGATPDRLVDYLTHAGPGWNVAAGLLVVVVGPVAEELFFRGWLWVGLRRRLGVGATGLATGLLFLAAHLGEGWTKPLFILPMVIALTLARHYGGSVFASIAVHVGNNGVAMLLGVAAVMFDQD